MSRCAMRSLDADIVRDPVNRQITISAANASTNDEDAHTITLNASASSPAISPTTPSTLIHASDSHDRARARRAVRSHPASTGGRAGVRGGSDAVMTGRSSDDSTHNRLTVWWGALAFRSPPFHAERRRPPAWPHRRRRQNDVAAARAHRARSDSEPELSFEWVGELVASQLESAGKFFR